MKRIAIDIPNQLYNELVADAYKKEYTDFNVYLKMKLGKYIKSAKKKKKKAPATFKQVAKRRKEKATKTNLPMSEAFMAEIMKEQRRQITAKASAPHKPDQEPYPP